MVKSRVADMLGVKYPIVQGGMHYVGYAEMAAAVSNAGGVGMITALTQPDPESLRKEIQRCRKMTDKPFGVNLTLLPALTPPNYGAYAQVVIDEGIKIVETAGNKPDDFIKLFKKHDIIVIHKCVAIRHALSAQKLGADILSIDGFDCAGHPGEADIGNWILLPLAARNLQIPFIASGGIATGAQMAAAFALGAEGVNMGTAFMATKECPIHPNIKQAIVEGNELSTTLVFRSLKNTERVYKNKTSMKVVEIEKEFPGEFDKIRPYVSGALYKESFQVTGDTQSSVWSCGPAMAFIDKVKTCQELMDQMVQECEDIMRKMQSRL